MTRVLFALCLAFASCTGQFQFDDGCVNTFDELECPRQYLISLDIEEEETTYVNSTGGEETVLQERILVDSLTGPCVRYGCPPSQGGCDESSVKVKYIMTLPTPWCNQLQAVSQCDGARASNWEYPARTFNVRPPAFGPSYGNRTEGPLLPTGETMWDSGGFFRRTATVDMTIPCIDVGTSDVVPDPEPNTPINEALLSAFPNWYSNDTGFSTFLLHRQIATDAAFMPAYFNDTQNPENPLYFFVEYEYDPAIGSVQTGSSLNGCPYWSLECNGPRTTERPLREYPVEVSLECRDPMFGYTWEIYNNVGPNLHVDWELRDASGRLVNATQNPTFSGVYVGQNAEPEDADIVIRRNPLHFALFETGFWPNATGRMGTASGHRFYLPSWTSDYGGAFGDYEAFYVARVEGIESVQPPPLYGDENATSPPSPPPSTNMTNTTNTTNTTSPPPSPPPPSASDEPLQEGIVFARPVQPLWIRIYAGIPGHYEETTTVAALVRFYDMRVLLGIDMLSESAGIGILNMTRIRLFDARFPGDDARQALHIVCANDTITYDASMAVAPMEDWRPFCADVRQSINVTWPDMVARVNGTFDYERIRNATRPPGYEKRPNNILNANETEVIGARVAPGEDPMPLCRCGDHTGEEDIEGIDNTTNTSALVLVNGTESYARNATIGRLRCGLQRFFKPVNIQFDYRNYPELTVNVSIQPHCRMPDPFLPRNESFLRTVTNLLPEAQLSNATGSANSTYVRRPYTEVLDIGFIIPEPKEIFSQQLGSPLGPEIGYYNRTYGILWNISNVDLRDTATVAGVRLESANINCSGVAVGNNTNATFNSTTGQLWIDGEGGVNCSNLSVARPFDSSSFLVVPLLTTRWWFSRTRLSHRVYGSANFPCDGSSNDCSEGDPAYPPDVPQPPAYAKTSPESQELARGITAEQIEQLPLCECYVNAPCIRGEFVTSTPLYSDPATFPEPGDPVFPPGVTFPPNLDDCEPSTEVCDGLDDDCDGVVDNVLAVGTVCGFSDVGACQLGTLQCPTPTADNEQQPLVCAGGVVYPSAETCNGVDDDCDGVVDNNLPPRYGRPCGTNAGPCQQGVLQCQAGGNTVCVGEVPPLAQEICGNGIDDDCDGVVDNGCATVTPPLPAPQPPPPSAPSPAPAPTPPTQPPPPPPDDPLDRPSLSFTLDDIVRAAVALVAALLIAAVVGVLCLLVSRRVHRKGKYRTR